MKILLADSDVEITQTVSRRLQQDNYVVEVVNDGECAVDFLQVDSYDLVLIARTLPKVSGIEVCRRLRTQDNQTPVLIMAEENKTSSKVDSLDAGADDYLVKPLALDELMARVRALLRRNSEPMSAVVKYGPLRFDSSTQTLTLFDKPMSLRPKELAILELMLHYPSHVFDSKSILNKVWRLSECPETATVKSHIWSLRKKFEAAGAANVIETVHGAGYRLNRSFLEEIGRTDNNIRSFPQVGEETSVRKPGYDIKVSYCACSR